jgi:hypothetical protein
VGYVLHGHQTTALGLLAAGTAGWLLLGYLVPWTAVLGREQRPVLAAANGTWFIWVVASQSVAALAAALEPAFPGTSRGLGLLAVAAFFVGVFLYAAAGVFVAARLLVYPLGPIDLEPPYWVAMGATAITVVAGAPSSAALPGHAVERRLPARYVRRRRPLPRSDRRPADRARDRREITFDGRLAAGRK